MQKHDIFTCENNMLSSHVKTSPLLWLCNKLLLSQEKAIKVKWFGISYNKIIEHYMVTWRYEISLLVLKIFHSWAIIHHLKRNFVYLRGHVHVISAYLCLKSKLINFLITVPIQGSPLRKIEGSPVLCTCEIQGTQHMISMKNKDFPITRETKQVIRGHRILLEHSSSIILLY